ncbi:MAG: Abi family protein [Desulfuromonadaceae bacterium]|nr:Abi family protein [Desulfuromonadaceae bacterium]
MQYDKQPLSIEEQVRRLKNRGMTCENEERFKHYLAHIGYYRLSAYWLPFEHPSEDSSARNHVFLPETSFENVLRLYIFDRKLRLFVMDAIERIEVAVRTQWANAMSLKYGAHSHMDPGLFKDPWQHARDLGKITADLEDSKEAFIVHYRKKYSQPFLPPIWAVVETMSLGTLSRWIKNTKDNEVKKEIMNGLRLPTIEVLESILHGFTPVRNVCAHHGRLWNRRFPIVLPRIKRFDSRMVPIDAPNHQARLMFNFLVVMEHLKNAINPTGQWRQDLVKHLDSMQTQELNAMGFPKNWKAMQPWNAQ